MASLLDASLVSSFSLLFTFVLVFCVLWAVLQARTPFGDNKGLYAIISLMVAFLVIISRPARAYIEFITPWMLVVAIAMFLIVVVFSVFTEVKWTNVVSDNTARTWIIIIIAVVLVSGLAYTFGQASLEAQTGQQSPDSFPVMDENGDVTELQGGPQIGGGTGVGTADYSTNLVNTLVHPKVLGLALIFLLSCLIVFFLTRPALSK